MRESIIWNITDRELQDIIDDSNNISQIMRVVGLSPTSQLSRSNLKKRMKTLDHTKYFENRKNTNPFSSISPRGISDDLFFVKGDKRRTGAAIKVRLIKMGVKEECVKCGQETIHNKKSLTLHVDHVDGDPTNNEITNLRFLCPNCHTQTSTFAGRNKRKGGNYCKYSQKKIPKAKPPRIYKTKIDWPEREELLSMLENSNFVQVGKILGVSNNAIKKHLKK